MRRVPAATPYGHNEVVLTYLFSSLVEEGFSVYGINLALKLRFKDYFSVISTLIGEVARVLGVPEDKVGVVGIDKASLPLKYRVLTRGVKLVDKDDAESTLISDVVESYPAYNEDYEYLCNSWLRSPLAEEE